MFRLNGWRDAKHRQQRGSVVPLAAIGMVSLLLAAGLAIDVSHLYLVGTELQNAADAGALAAASALNSGASGITKGVDRAVAMTNQYEFGSAGAAIARADVRFAVNLSEFDGGGTGRSEAAAAAVASDIRFVKVTITPKNVSVIFAKLALGSDVVSLSRTAVAGQSVPLNVPCHIVPLVPVQDDMTGQPLDVNPECPNQTAFTRGCTYTIRSGSNGNSYSAGNYQILAFGPPFDNDRGGSDARDRMAMGAKGCPVLPLCVSTEPGIKTGPISQGLNTRFDRYSAGLSYNDYPPDENIKSGITFAQYVSGMAAYQELPSHAGVTLRRIIILPIANRSEFDNGRSEICIAKFAAFFLRGEVNGNGNITAEYISDRVVFGNGRYDPAGGAGNPEMTVAVLYR